MTDYRLFLFNARGGIQSAVVVDCEDDAEALAAARAQRWPHQIEVWQRGRLVSLMVSSPAPSPTYGWTPAGATR
jgi:hypothetical protein